jgi:hypothetical protein
LREARDQGDCRADEAKIENMPIDVEEYISIEYPTIDPDWGK